MIDDRNSVAVKRVNIHSRISESIPDYEDVKVSEKSLTAANSIKHNDNASIFTSFYSIFLL